MRIYCRVSLKISRKKQQWFRKRKLWLITTINYSDGQNELINKRKNKWLGGKKISNNEKVDSAVDGYFQEAMVINLNMVSKLLLGKSIVLKEDYAVKYI